MRATIIQFTRDPHVELKMLTTFYGQPTVEDLLRRHGRMRLMLIEAYGSMDAGNGEPDYLSELTYAFEEFPDFCARAGINRSVIEEFCNRRGDLKLEREVLAFERMGHA